MHGSPASEDPEPTDEVAKGFYALDFAASKSIRYHSFRRSFWKAWDHWTKILSVFAGAGVVISVIGGYPAFTNALAVLVALFSTADVVVGFGDRANRHDGLYRDWCRFHEKLLSIARATEEDLVKFRARRVRIERDEPDVIGLLERRCYEAECRARGKPTPDGTWLSSWQVAISQFAIWANDHD